MLSIWNTLTEWLEKPVPLLVFTTSKGTQKIVPGFITLVGSRVKMKVAKKKLICVLILWAMFNPSEASLYPLALDVMTNLKNHEFTAVATFGNTSKLLAPYITELPKPIWLFTGFRQESFSVFSVVLDQERRLSKVVIFLPWLLNLPKKFPGFVNAAALLAVNTHWVVSTDGAMPHDWIAKLQLGACQVLSVSPTHIEEPKNGFDKCTLSRRNISSASQVFRLRERDAKKYPRNLSFTIIHPNDDVSTDPVVAAVLEAYASLNTSLKRLNRHIHFPSDALITARLADIDIVPKLSFQNPIYNIYLYAMYPPCHVCFFTRLVAAKGSFLARDSAKLISFISSFFLLALAIVIVSRRLGSREHPTKCSAVVLFLASTFLGRSPPTLLMVGATSRTLLALWMFGTFIVGSFLQSHITADICVQSFVNEVEDLQEFEKLLDARRVLPCVDYSFISTAVAHFQTPFMEKLLAVIHRRRESCVNYDGQKGCYSRVRQGRAPDRERGPRRLLQRGQQRVFLFDVTARSMMLS
ncbi:hypothetical protein HPB48_014492 [Haemaphysalis longicornis]|uniref:Ionotropic receptor n=1 Tax=Haemaphysalis longicornis TaxID=44386 RepID=A0A9J6GCD7_HAELO|nr:hypothetical protein HPB48_014492 [Haemaphysalis longicornis]